MVELLTDYTTQIYHALSTDARPAGEPGAQLREIDTGKRFIFDGTSWLELPDGGGGGGGISGVSVGQDITLTEPVRAVQLNIPSGWDWCCALINGSFTDETWLYWTRNELTTNHYEPKTVNLSRMFPMFYNQYQSNFDMVGMASTGIVQYYTSNTADYMYFYGYDKDFSTGTRFLLIGGSYANL